MKQYHTIDAAVQSFLLMPHFGQRWKMILVFAQLTHLASTTARLDHGVEILKHMEFQKKKIKLMITLSSTMTSLHFQILASLFSQFSK